jgi:hypothetical protein
MTTCEWIFSHRCSWMAVYVFCRNAQSESHSNPRDMCTLSLLYQLSNCNLFTKHVVIYLMETPLVNCGPPSNFLYIAITVYFYSLCLLYLHTITFYHSIRSILCLQQTGFLTPHCKLGAKFLVVLCAGSMLLLGEEAPTSTTHQHFLAPLAGVSRS